MSRNYYSEIHLHMVWHAKLSQPLLTPEVEVVAHQCIRQKIIRWPGAFVHEIGGIETHVHVVVSITPTVDIADFIGQLKGPQPRSRGLPRGGVGPPLTAGCAGWRCVFCSPVHGVCRAAV